MDINSLRAQIDSVDHQILDLLGERLKLAAQIGTLKKQKQAPALDPRRWTQVLQERKRYGEQNQLSSDYITRLWNILHEWSIEVESKI